MNKFRHLQQPTGRTISLHDKEVLFFGGTAYLGLLVDPDYVALYKEGIDKYGLNNGTSRNNNVQLGIYEEVEDNMARRFGFEACLLLSSGYLAAQLAIQSLKDKGEVLYAPGAHPALWNEKPFSDSADFATWAVRTVDYINGSAGASFVIVTNTLDNLKPASYDFSIFQQLNEDKQVFFLLDDSHGIGVLSLNACSVNTDALCSPNKQVVVVASLAKGMGTDAGAIFCTKEMAEVFRSSTFYTGASPSSPASLYALKEGEGIYRRQFQRMQQSILFLRESGIDKLNSIPNFPVFTIDAPRAFDELLEKNILISSFSYPLPTDPPINRIVISALHQMPDLEQLVCALQTI